ncbi:extracellular solute-binding protein [Candidatus Uhrbacteria bacterium]|nr:extracellular solute-binding protein [Candidatus Uhrbacteria bacterium]
MKTLIFKRTLLLGAIVIALSTMGLSCTFFQSEDAVKEAQRPITLEFWGVFDEGSSFDPLIAAYRIEHPNVTINYRKFRPEEYEQEIIEALAEDRGPDILAIHNTWVDKYINKLAPMPPVMNISFVVTKGKVKQVTEAEVRQIKGYTPASIQEAFVPTVVDDVIRFIDGSPRILGLPFSVDTLALFYNQTLLRNTGVILAPPKYWAVSDDDPQATQKRVLFQDFVSQAARLTVFTDEMTREIIQSGAAFGSANNIARANDILATLMLQNGSQMAGDSTVNFDYDPSFPRPLAVNPGVEALRFYTDFASPSKQIYVWNETFPESFEAFAQGRTVMFFGYSYHASQLASRAPQLRLGVAPVPQINPNRPAVSANYWVNGVSRKSKNQEYAWDFLRFATQPEVLKGYLAAAKRPTPLRSLIDEQKKDPQLEPFVSQLFYARNWYHGKNPSSMENAFTEMINGAFQSKASSNEEHRAELTRLMDDAQKIIQNGW